MLLFRGAQRGAQNFANQTPYQVKPKTLDSRTYTEKNIFRSVLKLFILWLKRFLRLQKNLENLSYPRKRIKTRG